MNSPNNEVIGQQNPQADLRRRQAYGATRLGIVRRSRGLPRLGGQSSCQQAPDNDPGKQSDKRN